MEEFKTLGQSIFQEIDGNYVLKEIYQNQTTLRDVLQRYRMKMMRISKKTVFYQSQKLFL